MMATSGTMDPPTSTQRIGNRKMVTRFGQHKAPGQPGPVPLEGRQGGSSLRVLLLLELLYEFDPGFLISGHALPEVRFHLEVVGPVDNHP